MLKISQYIKTNKGMGYLVLTISRLVLLCLNFNVMESCQCKLSVQKLKASCLYFALSKSYCLKRLLYELVQRLIYIHLYLHGLEVNNNQVVQLLLMLPNVYVKGLAKANDEKLYTATEQGGAIDHFRYIKILN